MSGAKKEKVLMDVIYNAASGKSGQCLLSPLDILRKVPLKVDIREDDLEPLFYNLSIDGYFDYERADFKGDRMYLFTLKEKGLAYARDKKKKRTSLIIKIVSAIAFAALGALVRYIIGAIIGN